MTWEQIHAHFPNYWVLVEAARSHDEEDRLIIEEYHVLDIFDDVSTAQEKSDILHRENRERHLFVLHGSNKNIDIRIRRRLSPRPRL